MIFLMERSRDPETVAEFMRDPRWRGLKAVQERRVYRMPGTSSADLAIMQYRPLWTRWMAEIGHPERMQPRLRQMLRESFVREFGYRLTDDQIDTLLRIDENKDSVGYERFTRNYQAGKEKDPSR
jgi:iron complex transport system substrate-binding protein